MLTYKLKECQLYELVFEEEAENGAKMGKDSVNPEYI